MAPESVSLLPGYLAPEYPKGLATKWRYLWGFSFFRRMTVKNLICALAIIFITAQSAHAANGEMGTGIPGYGVYANANYSIIWALGSPGPSFPAGCSSLVVSAATLTMEGYKVALSMLAAAQLANRRIRFYAHADRDGGCGIDYLQFTN